MMNTHDEGDGVGREAPGIEEFPGDRPSWERDLDVSTSLDELDSQLAALLADDAEVLARAGTLETHRAGLDPALRARLEAARDCLGVLMRAWPLDRSPIEGLSVASQMSESGSDGDVDSYRDAEETAARQAGSLVREGDALRKIGRFTILGELGHGGFGIVYLAHDPALGRQVALKLPRLETLISHELRRRFLAEARVAARLDHPNIVPIYDVGELGHGPGASGIYIASAYCREGPLSTWIDRQGPSIPPRRIARLMIGLAEGVQYLHDLGIIHRDLKPSNVLLQRLSGGSGSGGSGSSSGPHDEGSGARACDDPEAEFTPRVADFGLARLLEQPVDQTVSGSPIGSPPYMSPEQAQGKIRTLGPATDVYGLGAILYVLLTGKAPFRGETTAETIRQVINEEPVPPRRLRGGLPRDLETICLTCLQKEPTRRYASASALRDDLGRFFRGEPVLARPVSAAEHVVKWARRRPATASLFAALAISIVVGTAAVTWQWRRAVAALDQSRRSEDSLRHQVYLEKLNRAAREWDNGNVGQVRELLEETKPEPGRADLRDFEWFYLDRASHGDESTFDGHSRAVKSIAFGAKGKILASASEDHTIKLWDWTNRRLIRTLETPEHTTTTVASSPDGGRLATGADDGIIRILNVRDGRLIASYRGHSGMVFDIAFSPDGRLLASGGNDGTVRIWDLAAEHYVLAAGQKDAVQAVAFSRDGKTIAAGQGQSIKIFRAADRRMIGEIQVGLAVILDLSFSPDGKTIASAGNDGTIALWDIASLARRPWLPAKLVSRVNALTFSPDGKRLASGGDDQKVTVWDVATGRVIDVYRGHTRPIQSIEYCPTGDRIASGSGDGLIKVWAPEPILRPPLSGAPLRSVSRVRYRPDGTQLASTEWSSEIHLWNLESGELIRTLDGHQDRVWELMFSPDGNTLASAGKDGTVCVWDLVTSKSRRLVGHIGSIRRIAFSPDGTTLVSADDNQAIRLWDVASGRTRRTLVGPAGPILAIAFSQDGTRLMACNNTGVIKIYVGAVGLEIRTLFLQTPQLGSASFDLEIGHLATAGTEQSLDLWDLKTGRLVHALQRRGPIYYDLAFAPGGRRLLSAGADGMLHCWDTTLGKELAVFQGPSTPIRCLSFRPDGKQLATGGGGELTRIWETSDSHSR
jgi:eukaryotic-like serine/threonine-protein kinase